MKTQLRRSQWFALSIVLTTVIAGAIFYPILPARVASHWNAAGEVNGYMPRFWGAFLMPLLLIVLAALFFVIPLIDPKRANIEKFRPYFDDFILVIFVFLAYLHLLTLDWSLGFAFNMGRLIVPGFALVFFEAGILISHAEPNWTIGIRTPWTLSSETVWRKTHALGGKLFKAAALFALAGLLVPSAAIWVAFVPVILAALVSLVYSYVAYRQEHTVSV